MKIKNKRKIIIAVAVITMIIILIFTPKLVHVEFSGPKPPNELNKLFQNISMTNIQVLAVGANYSGGGVVENPDGIEQFLKGLELESGEEFIGITSIEFDTSGTDFIYLATHKQEYDIDTIYSSQIVLVWIEDAIEGIIFKINSFLSK